MMRLMQIDHLFQVNRWFVFLCVIFLSRYLLMLSVYMIRYYVNKRSD